jgi:hypothetical protein
MVYNHSSYTLAVLEGQAEFYTKIYDDLGITCICFENMKLLSLLTWEYFLNFLVSHGTTWTG